MKFLITLISLLFLTTGFAQTKIVSDSLGVYTVKLSTSHRVNKKFTYEKVKYNYSEADSSGNYTVLGNIDRHGIPNGPWKFYLGDVTQNGKTDWSMGKVKDGKLEGKWLYSWICVRYFMEGIDQNPQPCPNI